MSALDRFYQDDDGEPLHVDEALALARHLVAQGAEAGFAADVIADAERRLEALRS